MHRDFPPVPARARKRPDTRPAFARITAILLGTTTLAMALVVSFAVGATAAPTTPECAESTATPALTGEAQSGYWMLDTVGTVYPFGDAQNFGYCSPAQTAISVKLLSTSSGNGYWVLDSDGVVHAFGDADDLGSASPSTWRQGEQAITMAATPAGDGYWVFTTEGRVHTFGTAQSFGDLLAFDLNGPVVDSVSLPDGSGYYMVGTDGGVFAFGTAAFAGSMGGKAINSPVNGLVPDPDGTGYWLVAGDGGVFAFDADFVGSVPGEVDGPLNSPVNGMIAFGDGYLMVAGDGGIFNFSSLKFRGSLGGAEIPSPIVGVAALDQPATTSLVSKLTIAARSHEDSYNRSEWKQWTDADRDCQNARQEVLIAESTTRVTLSANGCTVTGGSWVGAFTNTLVVNPSKLDIDHMVPLANAHASGGWAWSAQRKEEYANYLTDPRNLIAVTASANRSKGARSPDAWKPTERNYWCTYATDWVVIKINWSLTVTQPEYNALSGMLDTCD